MNASKPKKFKVLEQLAGAVLNKDNIKPQFVVQQKCSIFLNLGRRNLMVTAGSQLQLVWDFTALKPFDFTLTDDRKSSLQACASGKLIF